MTARILEFGPPHHEERFAASVDEHGRIRIEIGDGEGRRAWTLTPRQAIELAAFLNNDCMARLR